MVATMTNPLRVGLRQERVIAPQCLVIFGASGDLTHRKLVPALFELFKQRRLPSEFALLGCARRPWSDEEFRGKMAEALASTIEDDPQAWEQFVGKLFYEPVDLQTTDHMLRLHGWSRSINSAPPAATAPFISPSPPSSMAVAAVHWPTLAC